MSSLPRIYLEDTLNLIQLVRETALAQGREAQANQLAPVMKEMQTVVSAARKSQPPVSAASGLMGQVDFRMLLDISKASPGVLPVQNNVNSALERNRLIQAMSAADMSDIEIARQFGMTREEVRLVLSIHQKGTAPKEVIS